MINILLVKKKKKFFFPLAVKCMECMKTSNTYDPLLDINLDIKSCSSLIKALQKSIQSDILEGDNCYACP